MRMDREGDMLPASELLKKWDVREMTRVFREYGEERFAGRIARRLVAARRTAPIRTSASLARIVAGAVPGRSRGRIHPATRTFQALRIAVNDELAALDTLLDQAPDWLASGGLFGVISFHSLEDRRVKTAFLGDERLERVTRKPLIASAEEQERNPRSRSAKFRLARRR